MRLFKPFIIALSFLLIASAKGDGDDSTLKFLLSKSDLVVLGKFTIEPDGNITSVGLVNYYCEFQVQDVLKGDTNIKDQGIKLVIRRTELAPKDKHPLIKNDSECILFLKRAPPQNKPSWVLADYLFGVQYPSPFIAGALKRVAAEK